MKRLFLLLPLLAACDTNPVCVEMHPVRNVAYVSVIDRSSVTYRTDPNMVSMVCDRWLDEKGQPMPTPSPSLTLGSGYLYTLPNGQLELR